MLFLGEYQVSFSGPGRLVLPKKMRDLIKGGSFVLTRGFDGSLSGYDGSDYEKRAQDLFNVSLLEETKLAERRMLFASTVYVDIDEQGRFVIPKHLLEYAALQKKVVMVGVGDHFELWDEARWEKYKKAK